MLSKTLSILFVLITVSSCGTGNKSKFEKFTDIGLPYSVTIIKDEYQDMGQDFARVLEIKLDPSSLVEIINSINKSKFFNPAMISENGVQESQLHHIGEIKGVWYRNKTGYSFLGKTLVGTNNLYATVDTVAGIGKFEYLSD